MKSSRSYLTLILALSGLAVFAVTRPKQVAEPIADSVLVVNDHALAEAVENLRDYVRARPNSVHRDIHVDLEVSALRFALQDSEGFARIKAARALGQDGRFVEEVFPVLLQEVNRQGLECLATEAILSMGKAAIASVLDRIRDPDPTTREKVLFLLGCFAELDPKLAPKIIPILVAASSDENVEVRRSCKLALMIADAETKP